MFFSKKESFTWLFLGLSETNANDSSKSNSILHFVTLMKKKKSSKFFIQTLFFFLLLRFLWNAFVWSQFKWNWSKLLRRLQQKSTTNEVRLVSMACCANNNKANNLYHLKRPFSKLDHRDRHVTNMVRYVLYINLCGYFQYW